MDYHKSFMYLFLVGLIEIQLKYYNPSVCKEYNLISFDIGIFL